MGLIPLYLLMIIRWKGKCKKGAARGNGSDFPQDTSELLDFAIELYNNYFYTLSTTDEDTAKTKIYRQNMKRRDEQKSLCIL